MKAAYSPTLVEILKKSHTVSAENLKHAQELQKQTGKKLIHILVDEGMLSEKELTILLSSTLGIPALNLNSYRVNPAVVKLIPKKIAERYELFPLAHIGKSITVAMSDPLDVYALDDVKHITHCKVCPVISPSKDIQSAIENYYSETVNFDELLEDLDPDSVEVITAAPGRDVAEESTSPADDAPVIRMVNLILQEAIKGRASDIHFEPFEDRLRIRYRIDGALHEAFCPPREMYSALLTRMKIISDLDITEKRLPQDGRFKARFDTREIDFRVSILPIYHGEKTVLRILDKSSLKGNLDQLGFTPDSVEKLQQAIKKPYGMALVTGPTGSGKSTTLYSILNQMNTLERNIMTIEDPVEYQITGITQTQVNADIGLSFSNGLRALLRQSPDIILVGEIRDTETADIAVKSALTGHLVFSTLHTNSAAGAISRLIDMNVEPFLIASSLIVVTAQRLMRRICPQCSEPCDIPESLLKRLPHNLAWPKGAEKKGYHGKGCKQCKNTGYYGRLSTMEVLMIDEEIQQLIINRRSAHEIEALGRKKGMRSLFEDALVSFLNGRTTLEEVFRITTFED